MQVFTRLNSMTPNQLASQARHQSGDPRLVVRFPRIVVAGHVVDPEMEQQSRCTAQRMLWLNFGR